ncbi:S1C family serine protease [Eionea flava]
MVFVCRYMAVLANVFVVVGCLGTSLYAWGVETQRNEADDVFQQFSQSIFQVQIINVQSGSQSAIGSGFVVKGGELIATNYHVISELIDKPKRYKAQILKGRQAVELQLVGFDVVNDLAILRTLDKQAIGIPLLLSSQALKKGETLFSIGNPHDIGMTVVQGIYNGLVDHRFVDSIHFSGAINSGMSGGPTLNHNGEVVGINVASSGNQIGFLVPVNKLFTLLQKPEYDAKDNPHDLIAKQVTSFSDSMIKELLKNEWPKDIMGKAEIVGKLSERLECWGDSEQKEALGLEFVSKGCKNQDRIFIHRQFDMGKIEYEYHYTTSHNWSSLAFYRFMQTKITGATPINRVNKESVNNFTCEVTVVGDQSSNGTAGNKKVNYCVRSYKKIPHLYDVFYLATTIDKDNNAMMEHFTLSGVTQASASQFLQRFTGALSWIR